MPLRSIVCAVAVLLTSAVLAAEPPASAKPIAKPIAETASATREALFAALAGVKTEPDARAIEDRIWAHWLRAPDHDSQLLLDQSIMAQQRLDYRSALMLLARLIERAPGYSEGWNQRAIVLFLMGAYEESLEAIERTLALEPKHFGALAGKGIILLGLGRDAAGQAALRDALKIHPWLKERGLLTDPPERKI